MSDYSTEASVTVNAIQGSMTGITALETGLVSINNQVQDIGRAITAQGNIMDTMIASVGVIAAAGAVKAAEAFGDVEQSMKIVQMVSQQTSADIQYLTQQANQFSTQYRTDIDQITEGLQTLGRAGLNSASEQSEVLENGLQTAKLEGRELNSVLEELIQNTALLGGDLKSSKFGEQTDYINNLLVSTSMSAPIDTHDVSETLKYSGGMLAAAGGDINTAEGKRLIEDYMGSVAAFAQKGVTGSIAGTALRAFFNKPATQDSSVLEGLSQLHLRPEYLWEDGGERMKPVSEQIALIQGQMDKLNISTMDQMQIWSKIVGGKMGQQMMKLDSSDIKSLTKDIQNSASAEELATKSMQTYESAVKEAQETAALAFRNFGEKVAMWLGPMVKIGNLILKIFTHPVGTMALFGGFLALLGKTVSIGIRYIRTFAADLKATLAGVQSLTNSIADKSTKVNTSAAATTSAVAAAEKIKETNKQQAQQKEAVNKAAIDRTTALEKAKSLEVKNEIDKDVMAIHNLIQRNIDETAANIQTKISSAAKSSSQDLTYLFYNDKGKLKQHGSYNQNLSFVASQPKTVVEPPARVSLGYTKYNSEDVPVGSRYNARKMELGEKQFESRLASIQHQQQRYIALNEIYHDPLRQEQIVDNLITEKKEMDQNFEKHLNGIRKKQLILSKVAYDYGKPDNIRQTRLVDGEKLQPIYDKFNLKKMYKTGSEIPYLVSTTKATKQYPARTISHIPLLKGYEQNSNIIVDYQKLIKQNEKKFARMPAEIQKRVLNYMTLWDIDPVANKGATGGIMSGITRHLNGEGNNPALIPKVKALINNLKLEHSMSDVSSQMIHYNKGLKYIEEAGGVEEVKLKLENDKLMTESHKLGIQAKQEEIDERKKYIKQTRQSLNTMLRDINSMNQGFVNTPTGSFKVDTSKIRQAMLDQLRLVEDSVNKVNKIYVPNNTLLAKAQAKITSDEQKVLKNTPNLGNINTPTGSHLIDVDKFNASIKEMYLAEKKELEIQKQAVAEAKLLRSDLTSNPNRIRLERQYQQAKSTTPTQFNYKPPSDNEISKQIKSLQLNNNKYFTQAYSQAQAGLTAEQRKSQYIAENTHQIGKQQSLTTAISHNEKTAALQKLGYEKKVTQELEKQVMLTEAQAKNRFGSPPIRAPETASTAPGVGNAAGAIKNSLNASGFEKAKQDALRRLSTSVQPNTSSTGRIIPENMLRNVKNEAYPSKINLQDPSFSNKMKNWFTNSMGLSGGGSSLKGIGNAIKSSGTLAKVTSAVSSGFTSLIDYALNPVMIAIMGITTVIDIINRAHEDYVNKLQEATQGLEDQYKRVEEAENNLKQVYESEVPDATAQDKEDYVLNIYNKIDENSKDLSSYIKTLDMGVINPLPKYEENEDGTTTKIERDELTANQSAAQSLNEIVSATIGIQQQMTLVISRADHIIWGINGVANRITDGLGKIASDLGLSTKREFGSSGEFQLTDSQKDENYVGNTELSGLMLEDFYNGFNDNDLLAQVARDNMFNSMSAKEIDQARGLETFMGKDTAADLRHDFKDVVKTLDQYSKFAYGLGRDKNLAAQMSMKQDQPTWSALAKEAAKEEKRQTRGKKGQDLKNAKSNLKPNKRMEGLVNKIWRTTGKYLSKQAIYQLMQFQQLQDIYSVATATFVPIMQQQAQAGINTALTSMGINSNTGSALGYDHSVDNNTAVSAAYLAIIAKQAAYENAFLSAKEQGLTNANSLEEFIGKANSNGDLKDLLNSTVNAVLNSGVGQKYIPKEIADPLKDTFKDQLGGSRRLIASAMAGMAIPTRYPNLTLQQQNDLINQYGEKAATALSGKDFGHVMTTLTQWEQKGLIPLIEGAYFNSNVGESDDGGGGGSGGGGSGGGGSGGGSSDKSGTKKDRVDLVLCSKKQIPKLDVNLFKKPPQFTILNKNFRLRDIKISTKDKPKAVLDSIKNAIIDTQQRMDPKIIQDEDAEYNPADATEGKSLPAGSTNTSTK